MTKKSKEKNTPEEIKFKEAAKRIRKELAMELLYRDTFGFEAYKKKYGR